MAFSFGAATAQKPAGGFSFGAAATPAAPAFGAAPAPTPAPTDAPTPAPTPVPGDEQGR